MLFKCEKKKKKQKQKNKRTRLISSFEGFQSKKNKGDGNGIRGLKN